MSPTFVETSSMPSSRMSVTPTVWPAKSRWQLERMTSNTGFVSAIELEIAESTSPEARCWSSASFVSLNSRTLSMAMAACRAKVSSSATWSGVNARGSRRQAYSTPYTPLSRVSGIASTARNPYRR